MSESHPVSKSLLLKGNYSTDELAALEQRLEHEIYNKGEVLLNEGEVCNRLLFLVKGAVYQYKLNKDSVENIIDLNYSNEWVINHQSFTSRKPSDTIIKAFEATEVYGLSIDSIHHLIALSQTFLQMGKILEEATRRVQLFDNNLNPDEKYQFILTERPNLLQTFPQTLIASYLKITPETLSRVRSRISK